MRDYNEKRVLDEHPEDRMEFGDFIRSLAEIGTANGLEVQSCSEPIEMGQYGVSHGKCVDDDYILKVFDLDVIHKKDPGQRKECGCVKSVDIGVYDTCIHGCQYCYATKNHKLAVKNYNNHNVNSPSLIGWYEANKPDQEDPDLFE